MIIIIIAYAFEANLTVLDKGNVNEDKIEKWLQSMSDTYLFVLCPGLPNKMYPPPAKRLKTCLSDQHLVYTGMSG